MPFLFSKAFLISVLFLDSKMLYENDLNVQFPSRFIIPAGIYATEIPATFMLPPGFEPGSAPFSTKDQRSTQKLLKFLGFPHEITVVKDDRVILSSSKLPVREGAILGH